MMMNNYLAIIDGVDFNIFFRGLLSVLAMFLVLCGGTYLIISTNVGPRLGLLIACAGFFGWMFLMGIVWTIYGKGWIGEPSSWELIEITDNNLAYSKVPEAGVLSDVDLSNDNPDPDKAQEEAVKESRDLNLGKWRYLPTSDSERGEAQATADSYLLEEDVYADTSGFQPLQFNAFIHDGKPILKDNPNTFDRVGHFFNETFFHPVFDKEIIVLQVKGTKEQIVLDGVAPPVAEIDPDAEVMTVIMQRDRGGPIPNVISGLRFRPLAFTIFNGILFLLFVVVLHDRDKRLQAVLAAE